MVKKAVCRPTEDKVGEVDCFDRCEAGSRIGAIGLPTRVGGAEMGGEAARFDLGAALFHDGGKAPGGVDEKEAGVFIC